MANIQASDVIGKQYGYLIVTEFLGRTNSLIKVMAKCRCGVVKEYFLGNLKKKNHTTSCGCHKKATAGDAVRTHGLGGKKNKHPLYRIWGIMIERCYNSNNKNYPQYGGRGVRVCDEWRNDFKAYYDWCIKNGWVKGLNIDKDKIGTGLLYSPETCCVITCKENQNNRRDNVYVEYEGEKYTLSQLSEKYKIRYHLLRDRYMELKWDLHKAITTPPKKFKNK